MENETDDFRKSDLAFNSFNGEDKTAYDKFVLPEVRFSNFQSAAEESANAFEAIESKISTEDDFSAFEASDKKFSECRKNVGSKSNAEEFVTEAVVEENGGEAAIYEEETEEMEEMEEIKLSQSEKKFTIDWEIEEIDEETEEPEMLAFDDVRRPTKVKMAAASPPEVADSKELLIYAKSKLMLRAASVIEQRLATIHELKELRAECKQISLKNRFLNEKCGEYFKKITTFGHFESIDGALPIHSDQGYHDVLEEFMELKTHYDKTKPLLEQETQDLTDSYYIFRTRFDQIYDNFASREMEIGLQCIGRKTEKSSNSRKIQSLLMKQQRKFEQVTDARIRYLKLRNRLNKIQKNIRALNMMDSGHSLMEIEQLMVVKHYLMDKLDEREEELGKLRTACFENVSSLGHMKEACDVFFNEITNATVELEKVTEMKKEERKSLAIKRLKKDLLRKDNLKIHSVTGFLINPRLLKKMQIDSQTLTVIRENMERSEGSA